MITATPFLRVLNPAVRDNDSAPFGGFARRIEPDIPIRRDLVQQVKARIYLDLDQYLTDQKIDAAIERLVDDILVGG